MVLNLLSNLVTTDLITDQVDQIAETIITEEDEEIEEVVFKEISMKILVFITRRF